MALMRLQLGGEVDLATGDELRNGLKDLEDKLMKPDPKPIYLDFYQQVIGDGVHLGVLDFGGPPVGRIWQLEFWSPQGATPSSAVPSQSLFIGPSSLLVAPIAAGEAIPMQYCKLPNRGTFVFAGTDALWCHANSDIVCVTATTLTAGTAMGAAISVAEWRESDVTQGSGRP